METEQDRQDTIRQIMKKEIALLEQEKQCVQNAVAAMEERLAMLKELALELKAQDEDSEDLSESSHKGE